MKVFSSILFALILSSAAAQTNSHMVGMQLILDKKMTDYKSTVPLFIYEAGGYRIFTYTIDANNTETYKLSLNKPYTLTKEINNQPIPDYEIRVESNNREKHELFGEMVWLSGYEKSDRKGKIMEEELLGLFSIKKGVIFLINRQTGNGDIVTSYDQFIIDEATKYNWYLR